MTGMSADKQLMASELGLSPEFIGWLEITIDGWELEPTGNIRMLYAAWQAATVRISQLVWTDGFMAYMLANRHCKRCRHWMPNRTGKGDEARMGRCCESALDTDADGICEQPDCAMIDDSDGVLVTGPEFGCVHWEGKA